MKPYEETIHIHRNQILPKYNNFAYGYGFHEKSKKEQHKKDRRNTKKEIKNYEYE